MSAKLQVPKTTTAINVRQNTRKSIKIQSAPFTRSSTTFGASTARSINSTSSSISSTNSCRQTSNRNNSKPSKSCTSTSTNSTVIKNAFANKRFNTHVANSRTSPFRSLITSGPRVRQPLTQSNDFAYDLSKDESKFMGAFKGPMKTVPDSERELLKNGQRGAYLAVRYEHSPDRKYNYPEATSWRIGWLHNQMTRKGLII
ncbi:PREDICTED: uncharacterized protein LOC108377481 [Rhagoletis zephyria]|uniref:uncharacterized protein LOC108377481 n=1 Tax=Rhagoletis zephyria TaxID=28612 RepID=UPI0008118299|nr:PREDICTED: uncharacterized protein LOC108377481 [Rhagoletis zephyria]